MCAYLMDLTVFQHSDVISKAKGFCHVVRNEDHRFLEVGFQDEKLFVQFMSC